MTDYQAAKDIARLEGQVQQLTDIIQEIVATITHNVKQKKMEELPPPQVKPK